jgi:hypothetical protein
VPAARPESVHHVEQPGQGDLHIIIARCTAALVSQRVVGTLNECSLFFYHIIRALITQTLPMESISRTFYHKKLYSLMQIFYHGVYLIFLSDLLLPLY